MPQIIVLPHEELCPEGLNFSGLNIDSYEVDIDHACDKVCACTTCHVIIREGYQSLNQAEDQEEDLLDKAWGLEPNSRLSCQAIVGTTDLVIEIPKYSINMAKEGHR